MRDRVVTKTGGRARSRQTPAGEPAHRPEPARSVTVKPAGLVGLQSVLGNRAVKRRLLMRQSATTEDEAPATSGEQPTLDRPLLTPAQVVRALSFYATQPKRYTPAVITQIQEAVGTTPTGKMSEADVQAVAQKQAELNTKASPPLKIDGMAGPRTLPTLFEIGLAQEKTLTSFTDEAVDKWRTSKTSEEETAKEIVNTLMKDRLEANNVPPVKVEIGDDIGARGTFDKSSWTLTLDNLQFQQGDKHDLRETTSTIYHECRHAEQAFMIARMLAGKTPKRSPEQITAETGTNVDIAKIAADQPLAPGTMEAVIAEGWYDSLHGPAGREAQRRNSEEIVAASHALDAAKKEQVAAKAAADTDPSPANQARLERGNQAVIAARARFQRAIAEHDDLPHEFDAERVESRVNAEFTVASQTAVV